MKKIIIGILLTVISISSYADFGSILENSIGWTISDSKIIDSYEKENGQKEYAFQGCDYGRVIHFRDETSVTCNSYGYQYAYAPTAIILIKYVTYEDKTFKISRMIVNNQVYDLQSI